MEITRHFTATTIIINKDKALLHLHKKLGIWIPVGGHIDRDELPQETAIREAKEESGLMITLYNPDKQIPMGTVKQLFRPMHILLEDINPFHQHIDFIYYAYSEIDILQPEASETTELKWFTATEINKLEDAPKNVRALALEAINLLGK